MILFRQMIDILKKNVIAILVQNNHRQFAMKDYISIKVVKISFLLSKKKVSIINPKLIMS